MTDTWIPLSAPDYSEAEIAAVQSVLGRSEQVEGPLTNAFEKAFASYLGRRHAIAVSSGTIGMLLTLKAAGIGEGDEVVTAGYSWHQTSHAIAWCGAKPVIADIDYWSQIISPEKAEAKVTEHTRAIIATNVNGHPADWDKLRALATKTGTLLIEDSTEAIGSSYQGKLVGSFGDVAVFDFSQPSILCCGKAAMIVTDDDTLALKIRHFKSRRRDGVDEVHWFLYTVHLGTRFSASSRDALVDDLETELVESSAYCQSMHMQRAYIEQYGYRKGDFFVTEKVADRSIALPFHALITENEVEFIVKTAKDASINVGAGAAIY